MMYTEKNILAIVFTPPPYNGQSIFSEKIIENLSLRLSVTPFRIRGGLFSKIVKILYISLHILLFFRKYSTVYLTPPGNRGLFLFLFVALAIKIAGLSCFIHHHSARGVTRSSSYVYKLFFYLVKGRSTHIFLCRHVQDRFKEIYQKIDSEFNSVTLSNAFLFFNPQNNRLKHSQQFIVGHLSIISWEKGIEYYLKLAENCIQYDEIRFLLAGPISNSKIRSLVEAYMSRHTNLEYVGPVFGKAKDSFFQTVNALILPSKLPDETEPLVMYEAFSYGADFFATGLGCIPSLIIDKDRILSLKILEDIKKITVQAHKYLDDPDHVQEQIIKHGEALFEVSLSEYKLLIQKIENA